MFKHNKKKIGPVLKNSRTDNASKRDGNKTELVYISQYTVISFYSEKQC